MIHNEEERKLMEIDEQTTQDYWFNLAKQGYDILVVRNYVSDETDVSQLATKEELENPLTWVPGRLYSIYDLLKFFAKHIDFFATGCNNHGFWAIEEWDGYNGFSYGRIAFALVKGEVYIE